MKNPYDVLGVNSNASDDEIKKAYRQLCRKYHPDANVNNPDADKAAEMFKDVQDAYNRVMDDRKKGIYVDYDSYENGAGGTGFGGTGFGGTGYGGAYGGTWYGGSSSSGQGSSNSAYGGSSTDYERLMAAAANYINARHFQEAVTVLDTIDDHTALWNYMYAISQYGLGNNILALRFAKIASKMEPSNFQYRNLVRQLESGSAQTYDSWSGQYGGTRGDSRSCCGGCSDLCMANLCLNMMCCDPCLCC